MDRHFGERRQHGTVEFILPRLRNGSWLCAFLAVWPWKSHILYAPVISSVQQGFKLFLYFTGWWLGPNYSPREKVLVNHHASRHFRVSQNKGNFLRKGRGRAASSICWRQAKVQITIFSTWIIHWTLFRKVSDCKHRLQWLLLFLIHKEM